MPTFPGVISEGRFPKGSGVRNWPVPGSVEIKCTRHLIATTCADYTVIQPIQNILRISEVCIGTRGITIN